MRKQNWLLVIAIALGLAFVGAVFLRQGGKRQGEILVLCGGSMRAALEEVIARYGEVSGDTVLASYGGSGELCAQIQQTRKGDLYVCHDPFMPWAADKGLIDAWATVGHLRIVIVVPAANPKKITELKDLAAPGIRLGVGNRTYSTSGVMVNAMLNNLDYGEAIRRNVRLETKGHQQRCTDVCMGALDAALVWNAVAHLFKDRLRIIPIPLSYVDAVTSATYKESDLKNVKVTIGIVTYSRDKPRARRFYDFALTQCGDIWEQYGFGPRKE